jgi:hypothetical protein
VIPVELRESAAPEDRVEIEAALRQRSAQLGGGEGIEVEDRAPPGEALRERLHERELLRTDHEKASHPMTIRVDPLLQIAEHRRRVLHFVENEGLSEIRQEPLRILLGLRRGGREIERDEARAVEHLSEKRGLSRLPRSGEEQRRKLPGKLPEANREGSFDPHDCWIFQPEVIDYPAKTILDRYTRA